MTRYLFFDIESPDGSKDAICEFGYVLTDKNFNIIDRNVLIINPEKKIINVYRRGQPVLKHFYRFSQYYNSPTYPNFYTKIKKMLTDLNTIVFGYSVDNDIRYVGYAAKRYGLETFNYYAYDVQIMHKNLKQLKYRLSLDKAINDVPNNEWVDLTAHRSDHDAEMTMLVLKHLLNEYHLSVREFIESDPSFKLEASTCLSGAKNKSKADDDKKSKKEASATWHKFVNDYEAKGKKKCALSGNLTRNIEIVEETIKKIKTTKWRPITNIEGADFIIIKDQSDKEIVLEHHRIKKDAVFITANVFLNN